MKKKLKIFLIILTVIIFIFLIPLLINIMFKFDFEIEWLRSEWSAGDALNYYGTILSFAGAAILGTVTVWQTKKANELSEKILKNSLNESTIIPQLQPEIEISKSENDDTKITMSTHHKFDYGAVIAHEQIDENTKRFNVYLMSLYFKIPNNSFDIKKMSINDLLCVQDPSKKGLFWSDNSNDPIPCGLELGIIKEPCLNWVDESKFYIQFKIYCEPQKCFDSMINNQEPLCIMFNSIITNINGIETKMLYKIWLENSNGISVLKANSTFIENNVK